MPRKEAMEVVRQFGGTPQEKLTRATNFLVVGDEGYLTQIDKSQKLKKAEVFQEKGVAVQIISESAFLEMVGLESKYQLENKYYSLTDILNIYQELTPKKVKYFQKWKLLTPTRKTNTNEYFQFKDLLYFRRINNYLAQGKRLPGIAKGLQREISPSKQLAIEFDDEKPQGKVLNFGSATETDKSAEQWYELGARYDTDEATVEQAIEAYEKSLEVDPDYFPAVVNLGNLYFEKGRYDKARELYRKADRLSPNSHKVLFNLGNLHDELGLFDQALDYFKQAIAVFPLYADAHFNIAVVYEKLGMVSRAREHWEQYLKIDNSGEWAAIAREHLMEL